jgi:hypothetical protein
VVTAFQAWADGAEVQMGYCLHGMTKVLQYTAEAVDFLAGETAKTFDWTLHVKIPKWLRQFVTVGALGLLVGRMIAQALHGAKTTTIRTVHTVTHEVTREVPRITRTVVHTAVAFPEWVTHIPRELKGVEKEAGKLQKRIGRVEGLLGAAAFAGLMANAIGGITGRCLRSGPIGRTARALCGLPTHLLDDFLSLLADFFILTNICSVIPWLEAAFSDIAIPITETLTTVTKDTIHCLTSDAAPLPVPTLHLPSPVDNLLAGV